MAFYTILFSPLSLIHILYSLYEGNHCRDVQLSVCQFHGDDIRSILSGEFPQYAAVAADTAV